MNIKPTKLTGTDKEICESIKNNYGTDIKKMYYKVAETYKEKCIGPKKKATSSPSIPNFCQKLSDDYGIIHKIGVGLAPKIKVEEYKKGKCTTKPTDICKSLKDHYGMYSKNTGHGIFNAKINQLWTTNKCKEITDKSVCQKISNSMGTYPGQWGNIWPGKNKPWPSHRDSALLWLKNQCNTKPWFHRYVPDSEMTKLGKTPFHDAMCHYISNTYGTYPGNWGDNYPLHELYKYWYKYPNAKTIKRCNRRWNLWQGRYVCDWVDSKNPNYIPNKTYGPINCNTHPSDNRSIPSGH